ncbi:hypothetical protein GDO81_014202 [Engystomops pustulosus]|uniref:Uncharacterized protein n=1 Tax=Engystomops pustulosus TaxID=76066 RepID=A0AAV7B8Q7_ENGPU|nr:hypothetical protein GDO81_014202 [Engystomops pustulosus]
MYIVRFKYYIIRCYILHNVSKRTDSFIQFVGVFAGWVLTVYNIIDNTGYIVYIRLQDIRLCQSIIYLKKQRYIHLSVILSFYDKCWLCVVSSSFNSLQYT